MPAICIIGGGISGLTVAHELMSDHEIVVLESAPNAGGLLRSNQHKKGFVINEAPNGWLNSEPSVLKLIQSLNLEADVLEANPKAARWIWRNGQCHPIPTKPSTLLKSPLLSFFAKCRLLIEPLIPAREIQDESLADFVRRRLGAGSLDTLVAPMCAGIFAAHPEELSVAAAFPLLKQLEKQHGSLVMGMRARKKENKAAPVLTSLKGGVGQLSQAIAERLGDIVQYNSEVIAVQPDQGGWRIHTNEGSLTSDVIIMACPAHIQAKLLRGSIPELAKHMDLIPYHSAVVAAAMLPTDRLTNPPDGFGVLVSRDSELHGALGVLHSSSIFPSFAPEGHTLTRTILGGSRYADLISEDTQSIQNRVHQVHSDLYGLEGQLQDIEVHMHPRSIPCYSPDHMRRQLAIRALQERHAGLYMMGNHLFGIGVKDCIRNATQIAQSVHHYIYPPTYA